MGVELFVRTRSGVRLTPAGELYLQHAYQLRAKLEQIGAAIRAVANSPIRQINIGVVGAGEIGIPYQILAKFSMEYPDIQVILHQIPSRQQQIKALQQGKILAAFNAVSPNRLNWVWRWFAGSVLCRIESATSIGNKVGY